jgi:hypothetical protein
MFHILKSQATAPARLRNRERNYWAKTFSFAETNEHETCSLRGMQFNPAVLSRPRIVSQSIPRRSDAVGSFYPGSRQASDEIHAYVAVRDMALAEATQRPSEMNLNRAFLANQLVQNSVRPAHSPYQGQCLPEGEAARERARCEAASARIAELRATAQYACSIAA